MSAHPIASGILLMGLSAVFAAGCAMSRPPASPFNGWKIVDLSHGLAPGIPSFPGSAPFEIENLSRIEQGFYYNSLSMEEHTGTHIDAPSHVISGGMNIDQLPLGSLMGPLAVIDLSAEAREHPDLSVQTRHLEQWEERHGRIPRGAFVVLNSGWARRWSDPQAYRNYDQEGVMRFPGFSAEAAEFLVRERGIKGMGVDTLSTDHGSSTEFPQHQAALGAGIVNLENLANLDLAPARGAFLVACPLKIVNGSGAPARIFALVPGKGG